MDVSDLVGLLRGALTVSAVLTGYVGWSALRGRTPEDQRDAAPFVRVAVGWGIGATAVGTVLTHGAPYVQATRAIPLGAIAGAALVVGSLFYGPARRAFDRMTDADVRALSAYRTLFGAFLFACAGLGLLPPLFALLAGTGDLIAGWLAAAAPGSLAKGGHRAARLVVHAFGAVDLLDVFALMALVVRPWLAQTGSPGPSLVLPWVAVPVLFAVNLHGLRSVLGEIAQARAASGARADRSEPARGVRGAVGGA
jgi:hypothetical protein